MDSFLADARQASMLALKNAGEGSLQEIGIRLLLPISLAGFETKIWNSYVWSNFPASTIDLDPAIKIELCKSSIHEINLRYSLDLNSDVTIQPWGKTPSSEPDWTVPRSMASQKMATSGRILGHLRQIVAG
jgi:hypothetical protein